MKHVRVAAEERVPCGASLRFDAAQAILAAIARPLGTESVPLGKAGRRVLAEPVCAAMDIPARDLAAMDGFAVREADLAAGQRRFVVRGAAYPGAPFHGTVGPGEAVRIMTGAPMPAGADRVLMRELVAAADGVLTLDAPVPAKPHVRLRGSDTAVGTVVLPAGRLLDPRALVVAAAADTAMLTVWRAPRVRVIATGDELVPAGEARANGGVPDSLSESVLLMARQWGAKPLGAVRVRDDAALLTTATEAALEDADVLVLCGGASRGDRDFAKAALVPLGLELAFADVAIKPGKPVWLGRIGAKLVLGLPGNPTAAMTVARLFLAPLLTALGGRGAAPALRWERVPLVEDVSAGDREAFLCAERLEEGVRVLARQSASAQCMLAQADALVRLPAGTGTLSAGTPVETLRF
ncbi:molybdopterin molybdotransferase MoeA [Sphingomonas kyeonggiensis]|uniref:Molybdopterin molybdenumtransferase n=1 Tax=Sphingomonas kyeonggiensis TaxID=1268553 RepID=A0A7W6JXJ6_9SPHN|nr:molybdopterin molybdotransferase MoeA [Sphingomonas kyeonggiensis]MBB4101418.1 molybdopterin molybdotransferase [Sphingomonas kyeonggiensis]